MSNFKSPWDFRPRDGGLRFAFRLGADRPSGETALGWAVLGLTKAPPPLETGEGPRREADAAADVASLAREMRARHGVEDELVLYRYRSASHFRQSRAFSEGMSFEAHKEMIRTTEAALRAEGFVVVTEWAAK